MRKAIFTILLISIGLVALSGCGEKEVTLDNEKYDEKAIRLVALDYIEGWYEGNAERMKSALHPDLIKRRIDGDRIDELNATQMVEGTKNGGGKSVPKNLYEVEVEVLHLNKDIATVMTKSQYIDYLHLVKVDNRWLIINVLWDFK